MNPIDSKLKAPLNLTSSNNLPIMQHNSLPFAHIVRGNLVENDALAVSAGTRPPAARSPQILQSISCPVNTVELFEDSFTGPQLKEELRKVYFNYFNPRLSVSMIKHARRLSLMLLETGKSGSLTDRDAITMIPNNRDILAAIPYPFRIIDAAHKNGIDAIEVQAGRETISIPLRTILSGVLTDANYQWQMKSNPRLREQIVLITMRCILDDCFKISRELQDLLQTLKAKCGQIQTILGDDFVVPVDEDAHLINLKEKFVDDDSPTLLLKSVGLFRVNYEMLMYTLRHSATKVRINLKKDEVLEVDFSDAARIYENGIEIYKKLGTMLRSPCKYTPEVILGLIGGIYSRLELAGKIDNQLQRDLKTNFKNAWPTGDDYISSQIDYISILSTIEQLVKVVRKEELFLRRALLIEKCLQDNSPDTLIKYFCNEKGGLKPEVESLFVPFSEKDQTELLAFTENKAQKMMGGLEPTQKDVHEAIGFKRQAIKKILRSIL